MGASWSCGPPPDPTTRCCPEEGADNSRRLAAKRVWVVDPLDGTRKFAEPGRGDWAVHVALVVDGIASVGAVALPAFDRVLITRPAPSHPRHHVRDRCV